MPDFEVDVQAKLIGMYDDGLSLNFRYTVIYRLMNDLLVRSLSVDEKI